MARRAGVVSFQHWQAISTKAAPTAPNLLPKKRKFLSLIPESFHEASLPLRLYGNISLIGSKWSFSGDLSESSKIQIHWRCARKLAGQFAIPMRFRGFPNQTLLNGFCRLTMRKTPSTIPSIVYKGYYSQGFEENKAANEAISLPRLPLQELWTGRNHGPRLRLGRVCPVRTVRALNQLQVCGLRLSSGNHSSKFCSGLCREFTTD